MLSENDVVARVEGATIERLHAWVGFGWVKPVLRDNSPGFTDADIARITLICDLHDRMGLDEESVPVVLNLVDQIHGLRRELKCLTTAIEEQPNEVRTTLRTRVEHLSVRWRIKK
jgi:chaperone modulatory protein CbpM